MEKLIRNFDIHGNPVALTPYGCGHINRTFLCTCDSGAQYILQKINKNVFKDPEALMENIAAVTAFLLERSDHPEEELQVIPAQDGKKWFVDDCGEYWRVYNYLDSTICLQHVESPEDFYNAGFAFGRFQSQLADFPADTLTESIHNFHNTISRYQQFHEALENDICNRAELCRDEIAFVLAHESEAGSLVDALAMGQLPLRVTHNDTKLNNVLFDQSSRKPVCVVDLDTVMPGSALYDYGDAIRFGASTAAEDEKDLNKVWCDMDLFRAYTEGFLMGCQGRLTQAELDAMPQGAKMMTLECGVRFLTDFLNGDTYFNTHYAGQNLDRARTQFKLVADMETKWDTMHKIVRDLSGELT